LDESIFTGKEVLPNGKTCPFGTEFDAFHAANSPQPVKMIIMEGKVGLPKANQVASRPRCSNKFEQRASGPPNLPEFRKRLLCFFKRICLTLRVP
jgi:hypothetical protein